MPIRYVERRTKLSLTFVPFRFIDNPKPKNKSVKASPELKPKEKRKWKEPELTQVQQLAKQRNFPVLKWRRVPVDLTRDEADNRIFIREFLFRFEDYIDPGIAKSHMEELEVIGGRTRQPYDDGDVGWVNEQCLKAIVLGLLGLFNDGEDTICKVSAFLFHSRETMALMLTSSSNPP